MQLHAAYLTALGLILYLQNAMCRTCGSEFDNIQSKAYLAAIVFEGIAESESADVSPTASGSGRHNVTFKVGKVLKGKLPTTSDGHKHFKPILVGEFGDAKNDQCLPVVDTGKKYIVFLNKSKNLGVDGATSPPPVGDYHRLSAEPVPASKKHLKRVREMLCKGCAKPPRVRSLVAPKEVEQGRRLLIKCRSSGMPPPNIVWAKDGQILSHSKHIFIKSNSSYNGIALNDSIEITFNDSVTMPQPSLANENLVIEPVDDEFGKGSRLRIKKVKAEDVGSYECQASNVIGWHKQEINISVTGAHYTKCGEELKYYCMYGGTCYYSTALKAKFCHCLPGYGGERCELTTIPYIRGSTGNDEDKRSSDRSITIAAIAVGVVVLLAICIVAYFMARNKRAEFDRKKERQQQATYTKAKYTKYPLNVQDDKPVTIATKHKGTQTSSPPPVRWDPDRETVL